MTKQIDKTIFNGKESSFKVISRELDTVKKETLLELKKILKEIEQTF